MSTESGWWGEVGEATTPSVRITWSEVGVAPTGTTPIQNPAQSASCLPRTDWTRKTQTYSLVTSSTNYFLPLGEENNVKAYLMKDIAKTEVPFDRLKFIIV